MRRPAFALLLVVLTTLSCATACGGGGTQSTVTVPASTSAPGQTVHRIAFASHREGPHGTFRGGEIYTVNTDGSGLTNLTNDSSTDDSDPSWSPDGARIAFASNRDRDWNEIYVMNADGGEVTRLTYTGEGGFVYRPLWSPDGSKIAFTRNPFVYVMNADGSDLTIVAKDEAILSGWSPDSRRITFTAAAVNDQTFGDDLYVVNADGTGRTTLTDTGHVGSAGPRDWSADGKRILFEESGDLYVVNVDGSGRTQLTATEATETLASWSPDGTRIGFVSDRDDPSLEIYLMDADGSNAVRLTSNTFVDAGPFWSPDGSQIVFASDRDGIPDFYVMNADGSGQARVTTSAGLAGNVLQNPDVR